MVSANKTSSYLNGFNYVLVKLQALSSSKILLHNKIVFTFMIQPQLKSNQKVAVFYQLYGPLSLFIIHDRNTKNMLVCTLSNIYDQ